MADMALSDGFKIAFKTRSRVEAGHPILEIGNRF